MAVMRAGTTNAVARWRPDHAGHTASTFPGNPTPPQRDATRLNASPRCGARTRRGDACRAPAVGGRARCRMHGGARGSGGQPGNRNAWRHGLYDRAAKAENRRHQALLRSARALLHRIEAQRCGGPLGAPADGGHIFGGVQPPATNPGVHGLVCQVSSPGYPDPAKNAPPPDRQGGEGDAGQSGCAAAAAGRADVDPLASPSGGVLAVARSNRPPDCFIAGPHAPLDAGQGRDGRPRGAPP